LECLYAQVKGEFITKNNLEDVFIWTEAFNCGELLTPFLSSYVKYHNQPINVFGSKKDLDLISVNSPLIIRREFSKTDTNQVRVEENILKGYKKGHKGTSILWTHLIKERKESYLLHIDADTLFLGDVISHFCENDHKRDFDLLGTRRPYMWRGYRKTGLDGVLLNNRPDTVNTDCFMFDRRLVQKTHKWLLERKIRGKRTGFLPVVDFFDPIAFDIIKKGGEVYYLDSPNAGRSAKTNFESEIFNKRINFAAVGSGINFYKNPEIVVPIGYKNFALSSWATYAKYILDIDLNIEIHTDYELISRLKRLDKINWKLI
jgi:hypothetical protein